MVSLLAKPVPRNINPGSRTLSPAANLFLETIRAAIKSTAKSKNSAEREVDGDVRRRPNLQSELDRVVLNRIQATACREKRREQISKVQQRGNGGG